MRNTPILSTAASDTRVIDVNSSAGFSSGSLVYMQNGNATSTPTTSAAVTFQAVEDLPLAISAHTGTAVLQAFDNTVNPSRMKNSATFGKCAAVLTNGNIVHVTVNDSPQRVYFTILDPNGADVVAFTQVSAGTTYGSGYGTASVEALSGGGFVVGWYDSSGRPTYKIYDNSGAVVLAETTYTGETISAALTPINLQALQNGNWVIAFNSGTNNAIRFAIFSPTGTTITTWTSVLGSSGQSYNQIDIAARSDGSFVFCFMNSAFTTIYFSEYDSAGTSLGLSGLTVSGTSPQIVALSLATMSDGTTIRCAFTFFQSNAAEKYWKTGYVTITGNTPGTPVYLPGNNLTQNTSAYPGAQIGAQSVCIIGLASGSFLIAYEDVTSTIGYSVFNSSGTCLTATNAFGAIPILIYGSATNYFSKITAIEVGAYINLYYTNSYYATTPFTQCLSKINKTTYALYYPYTVSQNIGSVSASAGAYVTSVAKPTQATYTTTSTFTSTISKPVALLTDGNTAVANTSTTDASAALIKDGSIICAEYYSPTMYISRYNNQGVLLSTIATVTGSSGYTRVRALADGGFVVMHLVYNSTLGQYNNQFLVYDSTYTQTTSFTLNAVVYTTGTFYSDFDVLKSQNLVYAFSNNATSYPTYRIVSLTGTTVSSDIAIANTTGWNIRISASVNDSFYVSFYQSSVNYPRIFSFFRTGSATWTTIGSVAASYSGDSGFNLSMTSLPNGNMSYFYRTNSTSGYLYFVNYQFNQLSSSQPSWTVGGTGTTGQNASTMTALGSLAFYNNVGSSNQQCTGFIGNGGVQQTAYDYPSTNIFYSASLSSSSIVVYTMCAAGLTNWFNYFALSGTKKISLVTSLPTSVSHTFVKDVARSDPLSLYPNNTSASGIIPNCPLIGVSLTTASAGGSGRVVTNGATTLNSNYSASTAFGNFDHQTYGGMGVKGSISGRTVTLTGSN